MILHYGPSDSNPKKGDTLWRVIVKQFLMVPQRTNIGLVLQMIGKSLEEIAEETYETSKNKWEARKRNQFPK